MKTINTQVQNKILAKMLQFLALQSQNYKIRGHGEVAKTLNREAMLEKLENAKTSRKSLKVRKTECASASTAKSDTELNA